MEASVVIAVYNQGKYIKRCLESLAKQDYQDFETIVVNDGSTDKTQEIINKLAIKQFNNLTTLHQRHQGPAKARNLGVSKSKGEILVFVDADMYFDKNFLKDLIEPIKSGETKGTFSTEEYVANWSNVWARFWNYNWGLPHKKRIDPQNLDQAKDFRAILRSEFNKVGGFDDTGYTDTWTLSEKLDYRPKATKAKYYHYNPDSLAKVFSQAKWVAKRKYKFGFLGKIIALLRANPLFSVIKGLKTALLKREPGFIIFKLVYDFGITLGLLTKKNYV